MKMIKIDFKNKKTLWIILGLLAILLIAVLLYKGLEGRSIKSWNNNKDYSRFDVANATDYSKYENKVIANFEGEDILDFSFLYKNDLKVEQGKGSQARWFKVINASGTNDVTLYFTYEGGRGWTVLDYINEVLNKNASTTIEDVSIDDDASTTIKYVFDEKNNTSYFVSNVSDKPWLLIIENLNAKDESSENIAKDIIRSIITK